ncbi:hypothetical protein [Qipengyuania sediminis]|uniref:hypothetical protein n=1 Tax=Qipengyuania sediminis TaxID=1532023 RepID=UPI001F0E7BA7|nr:hypothetical protein [Qipengyuania sediminis]
MRARSLPLVSAALLMLAAAPPPAPATPAAPSFADLATLADSAPIAVRVRVRDQAVVPGERAPGLAAGHARLYVEAETLALFTGSGGVPQQLRYLADMPLDAKGRAPKLKKREFVLFARAVPGRPGELQLAGPRAQIPYTPALETSLRPLLAALAAPDAPPRVTGVRDAASSAGALAGESETQIFLATDTGAPAALTVIRRPGLPPRWGVSWSELIDQAAEPPAKDTLAWYRLACTLPPTLPAETVETSEEADRTRAAEDYAVVIAALGPCERGTG